VHALIGSTTQLRHKAYGVSALGQCSNGLGWHLPSARTFFRYQFCVHYRVLVHEGNVDTVEAGKYYLTTSNYTKLKIAIPSQFYL